MLTRVEGRGEIGERDLVHISILPRCRLLACFLMRQVCAGSWRLCRSEPCASDGVEHCKRCLSALCLRVSESLRATKRGRKREISTGSAYVFGYHDRGQVRTDACESQQPQRRQQTAASLSASPASSLPRPPPSPPLRPPQPCGCPPPLALAADPPVFTLFRAIFVAKILPGR